MAESEIAQLLQHIALSYEAATRALTSPALVARHAFIVKHMENIALAHDKLEELVGSKEATKLLTDQLEASADCTLQNGGGEQSYA